MNADWMLKLYPQAWRAQHESDFRAMLDDREVPPLAALDLLAGAVGARLRQQVQPSASGGDAASVVPSPDDQFARRGEGVQAIFFAHLSLFTALNIVLFIINLMFTPGNWWFLYPLWGWSMVLALHAGLVFPWRGLFGAHLAVSTLLVTGLVAINAHEGGGPWSVWPLVTLAILVITHGLAAFRRISLLQAHVIATAIASLELLILPIFIGSDGFSDLIVVALQLWVLVLAHWLMRVRGWSLLAAHVFTFAGVMALLAINNAISEPGDWWVRYPFVAWGVVLVAHFLLASGRDWEMRASPEDRLRRRLAERSPESAQDARLRILRAHGIAFVVGSVVMLLLGAIDETPVWWAVWPIGVWLVLLAMHTGLVMLPHRLYGLHLFAWLAASVAFVAIDLRTDGGPWWYWPVTWWGVAVALHAGSVLLPRRPLAGMHLTGGIALVVALVITDALTGPPMWWFYPAAAIVFSGIIHFGLTLDLNAIMAKPSDRQESGDGARTST